MKKVAVIGSSSFLGGKIISAFKKEFSSEVIITGYSRINNNSDIDAWKKFNFPNVQVNLNELLKQDSIYYCTGAGIQSDDKSNSLMIYQLNTFLPIEIITFLNDNDYKGNLYSFGSYFEIGDNQKERGYTEDELIFSENKVPNAYCISKRMLSRFTKDMLSFNCFNHYHFILPTIYGLGESERRLIPYILSSIQNGRKLDLTSGEQARQYLHISDFVNVLTGLVLYHIEAGIYNLPGDMLTVKELVQLTIKLKKSDIYVNLGGADRVDASMKYLSLDAKKIEHVTSGFWNRDVSIEQGINDYVEL
jgi:nucleoside-diphosphate-sugar epimerase